MRLAFLGVLCLAVAGCAQTQTTGKEFSVSSAAQLSIGKTTKNQVRGMMGAPLQQVSLPDGQEVWTYSFTKVDVDPNGGENAAKFGALGIGTVVAASALGPVGMIPATLVGPSMYANSINQSAASASTHANNLQITFKKNIVSDCQLMLFEAQGQASVNRMIKCRDLKTVPRD